MISYEMKKSRRRCGDYFSIAYHGVSQTNNPIAGRYPGGRIGGYRPSISLPYGSSDVIVSTDFYKRIIGCGLGGASLGDAVLYSRIALTKPTPLSENDFERYDSDRSWARLGNEPEGLLEGRNDEAYFDVPSIRIRVERYGTYDKELDRIVFPSGVRPLFFAPVNADSRCCCERILALFGASELPYGVAFEVLP